MRKILFVELLGGVGDLVIALPAIHALGLSHPQAEMTVLTFSPGAELLASDPLVQRVLCAQRGDAAHPERPREALETLLADERFDLIVSDTRYAGIDALLEATGSRVVTDLWRQPPANQLIEERFLQILGQEGLIEPWALATKPHLSLTAGDQAWAAAQLSQPGCRILLHPHAGMPIKVWPPERFIALGRALRNRYGAQIVISEGVGAEIGTARRIAEGLGDGAILLPAGSLRQFAAAAARVDLVVGADSGPVRIAAAAGALAITLFGPTWYGRYGQRSPNANLQGFPGCPERHIADFTRQTCWYTGSCPLARWRSCLEDIGVSDVLGRACSLLDWRLA